MSPPKQSFSFPLSLKGEGDQGGEGLGDEFKEAAGGAGKEGI